MRRRHRLLVAAGLLAPACSPAPAQRATSTSPATPPAGASSDATVAPAVTTSTEPALESTGAGHPSPAPVGPTTTVTVTVPTVPRTTTTWTLPEQVDEPDEFDARDAVTARVSWYGDESGTHTANGDRYDPSGLTFAHLSMPFGTRVRFCGPLGCVVATCTDRGPAAWTGKTFDLSRGAFARVAPLSAGVATVTWERVG